MLINDEEDEEDKEDHEDDDDDGVDAADDGDDDDDDDDEDEDDEDEDEDEEGEDEDENEDDDPLPAGNLLSGGIGGTRVPGGEISRFPLVLLPAYSLLKQEQLQLAQLAFVTCGISTRITFCPRAHPRSDKMQPQISQWLAARLFQSCPA